jgi:hypothetical protein
LLAPAGRRFANFVFAIFRFGANDRWSSGVGGEAGAAAAAPGARCEVRGIAKQAALKDQRYRHLPATLFLTSRILEAEPYRSDRFEVGFGLATRHRLAVGRATG